MLYAGSVFLHPIRVERPCISGFIRKMARIQQMAAIQIMGAMKSTATDILDAHASLLPFHLTVNRILQRETLRMATHSDEHPLNSHLLQAARRPGIKSHPSPIHCLLDTFQVEPKLLEKIPSVRHHPKWEPPFSFIIINDPKLAIRMAEHAPERIQIFTDSSHMDGRVGAAANLWLGQRKDQEACYHLGEERHFTIFEAELIGIAMAVGMIITGEYDEPVMIGTDSQAAIKALQH